jgi:hypothetical protein
MKGVHARTPPGTQTPAPSHFAVARSEPVVHMGGVQVVPARYLRQAPAPSQKPSVPQVEAGEAEQSLRGLVPGSANAHVPRLFVAAQVWQVPVQAVSQQTPSTQWPLVQSPAPAQAVPFVSCGMQAPAEQK